MTRCVLRFCSCARVLRCSTYALGRTSAAGQSRRLRHVRGPSGHAPIAAVSLQRSEPPRSAVSCHSIYSGPGPKVVVLQLDLRLQNWRGAFARFPSGDRLAGGRVVAQSRIRSIRSTVAGRDPDGTANDVAKRLVEVHAANSPGVVDAVPAHSPRTDPTQRGLLEL